MLAYAQVFATEGVAAGDAAVLVTEIQIDGQRFLQQVGQGLVFAYDAPHEYVGLLRKDGGAIDYGRQTPDIVAPL
jgi:hypothetical protein